MIMWKSGTFANVEKTSIWFFLKTENDDFNWNRKNACG